MAQHLNSTVQLSFSGFSFRGSPLKGKSIRLPKQKSGVIDPMVNQVDLRVNNIDFHELDRLNALLAELNGKLRNAIIQNHTGRKDYVVTVKPGRLEEIKEALRILLQIVKPDRIAIEP